MKHPYEAGFSLGATRKRYFLLLLAYLLLAVDALGGVLRFYSGLYHGELLVYLPKALALVVVAAILLRLWRLPASSQPGTSVLSAHLLLLFSVWVAFYNGLSLASMGYMVLILAPFIYGMHVPPPDYPELRSVALAAALLWLVTVLGIFGESFMAYPWKNAVLEIYGKEVEVSRSWSTRGIVWDRLSGFTRLSDAAAYYCGALGIMAMRLSGNRLLQGGIIVLTILALVLTTTKSAILAYLLALLLLSFGSLPQLRAVLYAAMLGLAIYLPLSSTLGGGLSLYQNQHGAVSELLLYSFNDRLVNTWPEFLASINHLLIGEGLGGVGTPNLMYGSSAASPGLDYADSLPLYLIGCFGLVPGMMIYAALGYSAYRTAFRGDAWQRAIGLAGIFMLVSGIALDVIESVIGGLVLGMIVRSMDAPASGRTPEPMSWRTGGVKVGHAASSQQPSSLSR